MANQSVLMGGNPSNYDASNPIVIFLIQATIVIVFCRILHLPLSRIRQRKSISRVIAEVIGGILLGPTAFGRIPGFSKAIFPSGSLPNFNLVANIGLILFLFIVGLEVDVRLVVKNARVALSVGIASLVLPFGTGCFVAWLLHRQYADTLEKDDFGVFLLFIGTAFSITAFPVLARILTELKLLRVNVGVTVLAAGVGNDVTGWMLLALTIALVNASSGLIALYVILLVIAWVLILFYVVKPAYAWVLRRSSSDSGPTDTMMTLTILLVLISSFYTEIIGVHPIFGAFLVGMIIPHDNGYAVNMTDKVEDLVSVLFLPLYFASSGLKTDVGLLNDGKAWGYTIMIIILATASKVFGSMLAARLNDFLWRESLAVGVLMSCKGLVELIVLNVGLNSGILSQKVFTMFVIMALVTTFLTTPLTLWIYPPAYQHKVARWREHEIDWDGNELEPTTPEIEGPKSSVGKVLVVVNRVEGVAPLLQFTHFFSAITTRLHLVRIMEITDRLSQIIKVSESDDLINSDSIIGIFKTNARLVGMRLSYALQIVALSDFSSVLTKEAEQQKADLIVAPWIQDGEESSGNDYIVSLLESRSSNLAVLIDDTPSKPEHPMRGRTSSMGSLRSMIRTTPRPFSRRIPTTTQEKPIEAERAHYYFPLFQFGKDEVLALQILASLVQSDRVSAHIVFFKKRAEAGKSSTRSDSDAGKVDRAPVIVETSCPALGTIEARSHSRPLTAVPTSAELDADIVACRASMPTFVDEHGHCLPCHNAHMEVIECSDVLETALRKSATEARFGPLTVVLAHSVGPHVRAAVRDLDKSSGLLNGAYGGNTVRGAVAEVFAAHTARVGRICVVSARDNDIAPHEKAQ